MRRKRKLFYEINAPDLWWCGRKIGWKSEYVVHNKSSVRRMNNIQKAKKHATGLPKDTVIIRWYIHKGIRYFKEFIRWIKTDKHN